MAAGDDTSEPSAHCLQHDHCLYRATISLLKLSEQLAQYITSASAQPFEHSRYQPCLAYNDGYSIREDSD